MGEGDILRCAVVELQGGQRSGCLLQSMSHVGSPKKELRFSGEHSAGFPQVFALQCILSVNFYPVPAP